MTVGRKPKSIRVGTGLGVADGLSVTGVSAGGIGVSVKGVSGVEVEGGFVLVLVFVDAEFEGVVAGDSRDGLDKNTDAAHPEVARIKNAQTPRRISKNFGRLVFIA
jgi:hypothetical protein